MKFLFHPLLILTYLLLLMLASNPYAFGANDLGDKRSVLLLMSVFSTSFLIPLLGVALMKPLGLIKSLEMHDKQERIGPYIVCGVFYLWLYKNFLIGITPPLYTQFTLGATIALFLAFFVNIFKRISAYAVGMGCMVTMVLVLAFKWPGLAVSLGGFQLSMNIVLALALLIAGWVGFDVLKRNNHTPEEVWQGYAAGAVSVLIAGWLG
ncbi:MAG: hypothetical protein JNJ57_08150 [Saprospiraceae bacterium]|nr:hypothetical protein [Saprospiraceae bacterium]